MSAENILFAIFHPREALRAKSRQVGVAIEHSAPPAGSTFEEFPNLSVEEAARLMRAAGGVPLGAWSKNDQQRLLRGERPIGEPEHPNV